LFKFSGGVRISEITRPIGKIDMRTIILGTVILLAFLACTNNNSGNVIMEQKEQPTTNPYYSRTDTTKLSVSNEEWKKYLSPSLYGVARNKDTERAFTGKYWDFEGLGTYYCAVCGNALFRSDSKFSSSCGWPSFFESIRPNAAAYIPDNTHGMRRTEVVCGRCDSHLGHIFDDGPPPTGMRYCMNSISLDFVPDNEPVKK
jgi:peptide-methionine (R)-S-oxide reductase